MHLGKSEARKVGVLGNILEGRGGEIESQGNCKGGGGVPGWL